jgi:hypothetical protein
VVLDRKRLLTRSWPRKQKGPKGYLKRGLAKETQSRVLGLKERRGILLEGAARPKEAKVKKAEARMAKRKPQNKESVAGRRPVAQTYPKAMRRLLWLKTIKKRLVEQGKDRIKVLLRARASACV